MSYIGNTVENQNYVPAIDYFNGDGSTVAFTLSRPVASVAAVQAVISNVPQNPGSAFTVSGSTITFTSAPPSGTANIYVYYTSPNTQVVQPGQGTVGNTQMSTGAPTWDASGNLTTAGGQYAVGSWSGTYTDGIVQDYTSGTGRLTVGASDGFGLYNGGPSSRTLLMGVDSSGRVTKPYQPAFYVRLSGANNVASGIVPLQWDTKVFDTNNNFNTSTYTFTAPVAGKYFFGYVAYLGNQTGNYYGFQPVYNGSDINYIFNKGFSDTGVTGSCLLNMAQNDTFTVKAYCSSSATYYTVSTYFYGYLLG